MKTHNRTTLLVAGLVIASLSGCAAQQPKRDPAFAPVYPQQRTAPASQTGSIYNNATAVALFEDQKARQVGDVLTIQLVEQTQASKKADTKVKKSNSTAISNPTILGQKVQIDPQTGYPLAKGDWSLGFNLDSSNDFSGEGQADQSNSLTGNITVMVSEVLPNGNLVVRGEKQLTLNEGDEYIRLTGIVRPADIRTDNSVLSTRLADARISYSGEGAVADSNRMGWLARFFTSAFWIF